MAIGTVLRSVAVSAQKGFFELNNPLVLLTGADALDPMKYGSIFKKPDGVAGNEINEIFQSAYYLFTVFALIGIVFSIIYAGIQFMTKKNVPKEELFTAILTKLAVFWIIIGIVFLMSLLGDVVLGIL